MQLNAEGGVGLNAATSQDATKFYVSLPANKAELWFALESERFQAPVFRCVSGHLGAEGVQRANELGWVGQRHHSCNAMHTLLH